MSLKIDYPRLKRCLNFPRKYFVSCVNKNKRRFQGPLFIENLFTLLPLTLHFYRACIDFNFFFHEVSHNSGFTLEKFPKITVPKHTWNIVKRDISIFSQSIRKGISERISKENLRDCWDDSKISLNKFSVHDFLQRSFVFKITTITVFAIRNS